MQDLIDRLSRARLYDLSQPLHPGIPHFPTHPPFSFTLTKLHGETVLANGGTSAADAIALCTHNGTHIDALSHFSCGGFFYGGKAVDGNQSYTEGMAVHDVGGIKPVFRRGVLLDFPALEGVDELDAQYEMTPERLEAACRAQSVDVRAGDVVLLRTGWAKRWPDARRYLNGLQQPGPKLAGATWLSERDVFAVGSDTLVFEFMPSPVMEVHVHLLVERGIHIVENLALDELASARVQEFLFLAAPLPLKGATGSPVRALALVE